MGTWVQAWPLSGNSVPASEHQCSDVWALGLGGLLWEPCPPQWASLALPRVSAAVGLLVCPLQGSPPGDPSGGLPGNHSNVPAHSGWVGRQDLVNWSQGTRIRQKVNGQQVRLLLWSAFNRPSLFSRDQTYPSSSSPAPRVLSSQHLSRTRKDWACQKQSSVFNVIMTAIKTVNII